MGLLPRIYLHAPRLAPIVGSDAGTGAHAFSALPRPVEPQVLALLMVLYRPGRSCSCSLAGDRGDPVPGAYPHIQTSVPPRRLFRYWHSSWRSFDRCLSDTGALRSASSARGVSGGGALSGALPNGVSPPSRSALLCRTEGHITGKLTNCSEITKTTVS